MNGFYVRQILQQIATAVFSILMFGFEVGGIVALVTAAIGLSIALPLIWWWKSSIDDWVKKKKDYETSLDNWRATHGQ